MSRGVREVVVALGLILVSAALGLLAAYQAYEASRLLSAVLVPHGTLDPVGWRHAVVLLPRVLLLVLMGVWLVALYLWMHFYVRYAHQPRRLWSLFRKTTVAELIVLGVAAAVNYGVLLIP